MKKARRIPAFVAALFFALFFTISSVAVSVDGNIEELNEWSGMPFINLSDEESECDLDILFVRYDLQKSKNTLYVAFQCVEFHVLEDFEKCGFNITINDKSPITILSGKKEYDKELYSVKAEFSEENDGYSAEIKIVFKEGIGKTVDFKFSIFDSVGGQSKEYDITMKDEPDEITTSSSAKTLSKTKTTKVKTTKQKTTKQKTTKSGSTTFKYHTVDPNDYTTDDYYLSEYEETTTSDKKSKFKQADSDSGKAIIKTAAVCVAAVTGIAFASKLFKKKR